MAPEIDVLGIGCVAVDEILYLPSYPSEDSKMRVNRSVQKCGGLTGMALEAAARLGGRCAFGGLIGFDELSRVVLENFERCGVDTSCAVRDAEARPIYSVALVSEVTQSRTLMYEFSAPCGATPDGPLEDVIRSARVLFLDHVGIEGGVRAARIARSNGIPVVCDFEERDHRLFGELLGLVDHLVLSGPFALELTGAVDAASAAASLMDGSRTVVVTCGAEGAWFGRRSEVVHQPAFQIVAVDTTGCGDVFHGAYALALARSWSLEERVRFASAAAALKAMTGQPPAFESVQALLGS